MKRLLLTITLAILIAQSFYLKAYAQGPEQTEEIINVYIHEVAAEFDLSESLLASLIYEESRFIVLENLTQITNKKWFEEGIEHCESDDLTNPYVNIRICGYYLSKWAKEYDGEPAMWLMAWNQGYEKAKKNYKNPSSYAKRIIRRAEQWIEEGRYKN